MKKVRLVLYVAAVLLIVAAAGWNVVRSEIALRRGTLHRMAVRGFDPHDPFRGRYLAFAMPNQAAHNTLDRKDFDSSGSVAYVSLKTGPDGRSVFDTLTSEPPAEGDHLKVSVGWMRSGHFEPPFSRFYLNEAFAPEAEKLLNQALRNEKARAEILFRVYRGHAALVDLQIDGRSIVELARESRGR